MIKKVFAFCLISMFMLATLGVFARNFTLRNNGSSTLTIRYLSGGTGASASWSIAPGASVVHSVADGTAAIRYWADTGANSPPCNTLAEFTLNGAGGLDYYDVSLVDGFNVAVQIVPSGGSGNGTKYSCGIAGCTTTSLVANCPSELKSQNACCSACMIFGSPQYCCTGSYNTPATCPPTSYSNYFKTNCPDAYSYAYDDTTSTYTCTGPSYTINFAGGSSGGGGTVSTPTPTRASSSTATPTRASAATPTPPPGSATPTPRRRSGRR
ncbi:MAG: hypothetical protein JW969_20705 [Spirochaetales bacterium]|nr:hypothetical protein [Spirochaetales bacterium]